jgi:hypothetical protein
MNKLIKAVPDGLIVSGGLSISFGAGLLHEAAGFVVAGILLIVGGICAARRQPVEKEGG